MSFWQLSDNASATDTGTEFDAGGSSQPIPDGTSVMAMPDEAKWTEYQGTEYISLRWRVVAPDAYANRVIFQKLYVSDDKPGHKDPAAYRDKALRMLAAIDKNAGGKLLAKKGKPTSDDLALALTNKRMVLRLGVWDIEGKSGNWVQAVSDKNKAISDAPAKARKPAPARPAFDEDLDDDVPF